MVVRCANDATRGVSRLLSVILAAGRGGHAVGWDGGLVRPVPLSLRPVALGRAVVGFEVQLLPAPPPLAGLGVRRSLAADLDGALAVGAELDGDFDPGLVEPRLD